ncbi:MAG: hypothetical protein QF415_04970 [Candidatus Undinarchaeales archaeon]|jgi:hypothetical protein|nr:hypothetical protein [Candidatus Undinarchaeales archaeon]MDP7493109.1 hypothetical protein [Candidatus Undinarchaeales archaeon]
MLAEDLTLNYSMEGGYREALITALSDLQEAAPGLYLSKEHVLRSPPGESHTTTYRCQGDRKGALETALNDLGDEYYISKRASIEGKDEAIELSSPRPIFKQGGGGPYQVPPVDHWEYTTATDAADKVATMDSVDHISFFGSLPDYTSVLGSVLGQSFQQWGSFVLKSREHEERYAVIDAHMGWNLGTSSYDVTITDAPISRKLDRPRPVFGKGGSRYGLPPIDHWDKTSIGEVLESVEALDEIWVVHSEERFNNGYVGGWRLEATDRLTFRGKDEQGAYELKVESGRTFPIFGHKVLKVRVERPEE